MTLVEERPPKKEYQPRPADDVVEPQTEPVEEPVDVAAEPPAAETNFVQPDIPYTPPDPPVEEVSAEQAESSSGEQTENEQPNSTPDGSNE